MNLIAEEMLLCSWIKFSGPHLANCYKLNDMCLCWMPKEDSRICARVCVQLIWQSGDVSRVRPILTNLERKIAGSFHLSSTEPHLPHPLFSSASREVGSCLPGAHNWSIAAAHIYLHDPTPSEWADLLAQEALPARGKFWIPIQREFFEGYQFLHSDVYERAADLALPWDL